ncbi:DEAD/DEAH box helicase [Egibacter rhizosphaerae]|uniref:DEAD/DEAH box helicase n=1 Tax=Egibacter rhizosphaerae TaxID=1670831 RepID=A0A411YCQ9_9ACTN|nr:DEAD/DEAH box helicase [Egibacter rhizosphaerae]QBI19021.1 DEAD/DEAH box helicase [Egibacter rhizosphaerae]
MRADLQVTYLPAGLVPAWGQLLVYDAAPRGDSPLDTPSGEAPDRVDGADGSHADPTGASGPGASPSDLADAARTLGLPPGEPAHARLAVLHRDHGGVVPRAAEVAVRAIRLRDALPALLAVPADVGPLHRRRPDSLRAFALTARLAWRLVIGHRIVPSLALDEETGEVAGTWRALPTGDEDAETLLRRLVTVLPPAAHAVPRDGDDGVWRPDDLLAVFCDGVADLCAREGSADPREGRPRARILPWTARWEEALRDTSDPLVPLRDDAADLVAGVAGWHATVAADDAGVFTELRLVAPSDPEGDWVLHLGVRTETGAFLPADQVWASQDDEDDPGGLARQEVLLAGLGRCARVFPPLEQALAEAVPEAVTLDLEGAWEFLSEAAPLLEAAGVLVQLPDELATGHLRVRLRVGEEADEATDHAPELDAAEIPFRWEVVLGDEPLDEEEVAGLLAAQRPLVRWRDQWVRLDPEEAERIRGLSEPGTLLLGDALGLALSGAQPASGEGPAAGTEAEVVADGRVAELVRRLQEADRGPAEIREPVGFEGELRPYQQRGVAWLAGMGRLGFGAVLADDMGLGKTIQLIGYLLVRGGGPHLVVCPTSVVGNWERELRRFAPELPVTRHHGSDRPSALDEPNGVVLTTYGTLRRDVDLLEKVGWDVVTLDEAQHVKNPQTAGAKAVRRLQSGHTVVMTGTPLENRLAELWSLMDVTNPGLLGTRARFGRQFVTPIEKRRDATASLRLRRLVAPFILRREKTDPEVISDLPDKIERTVVCPLTPEQAEHYEREVSAAFETGGAVAADGSDMERRGRVLALLTKLKQVCNHPAQAYGTLDESGVDDLATRSGKLAVCRDLVRDALDSDEQVIIFTQYVAMGRILSEVLARDLDVDVPLLHGGVNATARDRMVARFQGEDGTSPVPVLVVSLRAGGTGLNLTAATQVIHYDRWWNPAVEDQATDRAHRIGQYHTVDVHKLVTAGTVEERVADLLESKRYLADSVVGAGEAWVTELGDDEIAELVALGSDADISEIDEDGTWSDALEATG